jgi:membrane protein
VLGLLTLPALRRLLAPGAASYGTSQSRHAQEGGDAGRQGGTRVPGARRGVFAIAKEAVLGWVADSGASLGASIAFYTIFALAPLLLVVLGIAGAVFGDEAASGQLFDQIRGLVGDDAAANLQQLVASSRENEGHGVLATVITVVTVLVGASGVFIELKRAFDVIFKPKPKADSAVTLFVRARLVAIALVLALGFLVVVSLLLSAAVAAFGAWLSGALPALEPVMSVVDIVISTAVLTVAFWLLIRFLPDVTPRRRAVWIGALVSALLFAIGKQLIGLYLARGAVASAYGAAGSFIVVVLWVYYSAQILLLGAEVARALDAPRRSAERADAGGAALAGASTR